MCTDIGALEKQYARLKHKQHHACVVMTGIKHGHADSNNVNSNKGEGKTVAMTEPAHHDDLVVEDSMTMLTLSVPMETESAHQNHTEPISPTVFGDTRCFFIQNSKNKEAKEKHTAKHSRSAKHAAAGKIDIENINNNNTSKTRTGSETNHNQSIQDNHLSKDSQGVIGTGSHVEDMGQANGDTDTVDKPKEVVSNKGNNVEGDVQELDTVSCNDIQDGETGELYKANNPDHSETNSNKDNIVNVAQNGVEVSDHCDNHNIGTMDTAESLEHKPTHSDVKQMMNNTEESHHSVQDERSDDKSMEPITKKQKVVPQSCDLGRNVAQSDNLGRNVTQSDYLGRNVAQSDNLGRNVAQADNLGRNLAQSDDLGRHVPQSDNLGRNVSQSDNLGTNVPQSDNLGRNLPQSDNLGRNVQKSCEVARNPLAKYPKLYYASSQVLHKKRTSSVESANKQSIYQHFTMTKRQLSLDSTLRIEHNKAKPTNSIEFPFPVQSLNEHRIKAGVKLGLYDQRTLEKLEKSRKSSKIKLPNLTFD